MKQTWRIISYNIDSDGNIALLVMEHSKSATGLYDEVVNRKAKYFTCFHGGLIA